MAMISPAKIALLGLRALAVSGLWNTLVRQIGRRIFLFAHYPLQPQDILDFEADHLN